MIRIWRRDRQLDFVFFFCYRILKALERGIAPPTTLAPKSGEASGSPCSPLATEQAASLLHEVKVRSCASVERFLALDIS